MWGNPFPNCQSIRTFAICENKGKPFVRETKLTRAHSIPYTGWPVASSLNLINRRGTEVCTWIAKHIKISILAHSGIYQRLYMRVRYDGIVITFLLGYVLISWHFSLNIICICRTSVLLSYWSLVHLIFVYFEKAGGLYSGAEAVRSFYFQWRLPDNI